MQEFFQNRKQLCTIQNKSNEYIVFKRVARSSSRFSENNIWHGLLQDITAITNGDIVTCGTDVYFVVAMRKSYLSNTAQLYKTNCSPTVVRLVKHYTNGTYDYNTETLVGATVALQEDITGKMQQFDAGLLPKTIKKFIVKADVKLLDRIKLGGKNYQVDSINTTAYEGLLEVQCSEDTRVTK